MEIAEVLVRIPRDKYDYMIANPLRYNVCDDEKILYNYIKHGTVLPKGHGRLIDESKITEVYMDTMEGHVVNGIRTPNRFTIIGTDAPTIIEADKEEEHEDSN